MTKKQDITNDDIMQALSDFANSVLGQFDGVHERFDKLEARTDGIEIQLGGLRAEINGMQSDITSLKSNVTHIVGVLDGVAGQLETEEIERLALARQVDRHEDWIVASAKAKAAQPYHPSA